MIEAMALISGVTPRRFSMVHIKTGRVVSQRGGDIVYRTHAAVAADGRSECDAGGGRAYTFEKVSSRE